VNRKDKLSTSVCRVAGLCIELELAEACRSRCAGPDRYKKIIGVRNVHPSLSCSDAGRHSSRLLEGDDARVLGTCRVRGERAYVCASTADHVGAGCARHAAGGRVGCRRWVSAIGGESRLSIEIGKDVNMITYAFHLGILRVATPVAGCPAASCRLRRRHERPSRCQKQL
jgi:hypothetical protein